MVHQDQDVSFFSLLSPLTDLKAVRFLLLIGLVVYFYIFFNGFVWDDITYIIKNPEIHQFNPAKLFGPNTFNSSGYFRPLPAVYFSLLYQFFGETAFFYHFIQLSLHIACSGLLYLIFRRFFSAGISLLLGLIFLVHPVNVESVAYIGSTQSQMFFLFGGWAFYLAMSKILPVKRIIIIHLLLAGALFTKEVSIIYFFLIYIYRWLNRYHVSRGFVISSILVFLVYIPIRLTVLGKFLHHMQLIPIAELSLGQRLLHIPSIFFYYLKTFFFPHILAINQIWTIDQITLSNFYLPLFAGILFLFVLISGLFKYGRTYLFFLLWFLSGMAFLLQIFPLDMTVADRWFYLPMVGLLGIIGLVIARLKTKQSLYLLSGIILIALSVRTMVRTTDWYNPLVLYSRDAAKFPNYDIENNLGAELAFSGDFPSALPHFLRSAELWPHDTNLYNTATAYEKLGDYLKAKELYQKALEIKNDFPVHDQVRLLSAESLGKILLLHDTDQKANEFLTSAVEKYPESGTLWAYLGINLYRMDNYPSALAAAKKSRELLDNPSAEKLYRIILDRKPLTLDID